MQMLTKSSVFWHQNNRLIISEPTRFIVRQIPQSPPSLAQYLTLAVAFILSGTLHLVIDIASGIPWRESGAMRFFGTQVLGIMLEESLQAICSRSHTLKRLCEPHRQWIRVLGYVYVAAFMVWSVPGWIYPTLRRTRSGMQDSVLPFSILANFV